MRSSSPSENTVPADTLHMVKLPHSLLEPVLPDFPQRRARGRAGQLTAAVRRLFVDLSTLFGLPAPMRRLLEKDRAAQGITNNVQYVQWLAMQRAADLSRADEKSR
jgi:hypothetical protein